MAGGRKWASRAGLRLSAWRDAAWRIDGFTVLLLAVAALGGVLAFAAQMRFGAALSAESVEYLAMARSLLAGHGLAGWDGEPSAQGPPLYPLLLALAGLGLIPPGEAAGPLNAAFALLTILAVSRYLRPLLASRFLVVWAGLAIALSLPLAAMFRWASPEPLLLLLATLGLIQCDRFLATGRTSAFVGAIVLCALAWQASYAGFAVAATVGMALALRPGPAARRVWRVGALALITALPMALWLWRSQALADGVDWPRMQAEAAQPLRQSLAILGEWAGHFGLGWLWTFSAREVAIALALAAPPAAVATLGLFKARSRPFAAVRQHLAHTPVPSRRHPAPAWRAAGLFGGFAVTYFALCVGTPMGDDETGRHERHLAPLVAPFAILAVIAFDALFRAKGLRRLFGDLGGLPGLRGCAPWLGAHASSVALPLALALALALAGQVAPSVRQIERANGGDVALGYAAPAWANSATLRHLRDHPLAGVVYSNAPLAVSAYNGGSASARPLALPHTFHALPPHLNRPINLPEDAHIVWLNPDQAPARALPGFTRERLLLGTGFALVAKFVDGGILRVEANHAPTPAEFPTRLAVAGYAPVGGRESGSAESAFRVYRRAARLAYHKAECGADDVDLPFFLHVIPLDRGNLPEAFRPYGFDNLDFSFQEVGSRVGSACVALNVLPDYAIVKAATGQFGGPTGARHWDVIFLEPHGDRTD